MMTTLGTLGPSAHIPFALTSLEAWATARTGAAGLDEIGAD